MLCCTCIGVRDVVLYAYDMLYGMCICYKYPTIKKGKILVLENCGVIRMLWYVVLVLFIRTICRIYYLRLYSSNIELKLQLNTILYYFSECLRCV